MHDIAFLQWRLIYPNEMTFVQRDLEELVLKRIQLSVLILNGKCDMKYKSMHDFEIRNSKFYDYTAVFSQRYKHSIVRL